MAERERVGPYELIEPIGSGGFATVWAAHDPRLDAQVAVKVLAENHALHPDVRARFLSEGRLLRRVDSPHLVTVYDVGETDRGQPYLVLELADGGTLEDRVAKTAPTAHDVTALASALRDALRAVHSSGLVHRDIKPSNILIKSGAGNGGSDGLLRMGERFVLADFGFAKDLALHSGLTVAGGTRHWSAPEQHQPGTVDARADLYAVARIFEWMALHAADAAWARPVVHAVAPALAPDPTNRQVDLEELLARVVGAVNGAAAATLPTVVDEVLPNARQVASASDALPVSPRPKSAVLAVVAGVIGIGLLAWLVVLPRLSAVAPSSALLGGERVAIEGPASISVGSIGQYQVTAPESATITWSVPGVESISSSRVIEVAGVEAGELVIEAAVANDDDVVGVAVQVAVVDPSS